MDPIRPDYYQRGIEPRKIIKSWGLNFNLGNALKYILRPGKAKTVAGRIEDLRKAITYLQFEIEDLQEATDQSWAEDGVKNG